jgi:hypothetical protein
MELQELLWPLVYPQLVLPNDNAKRHQAVRQFFDDEASNDGNGDIDSCSVYEDGARMHLTTKRVVVALIRGFTSTTFFGDPRSTYISNVTNRDAHHDSRTTTANTATMIKHHEGSSCQAVMSMIAFIVPDDHVDEGSGSVSEPEGAGGSAAAEGADASAAAECTRSGRRGLPPRGAPTGSCGGSATRIGLRRSVSLLLYISSCHFVPSHPVIQFYDI